MSDSVSQNPKDFGSSEPDILEPDGEAIADSVSYDGDETVLDLDEDQAHESESVSSYDEFVPDPDYDDESEEWEADEAREEEEARLREEELATGKVRPEEDDFNTYDEYVEALTDFKVQQATGEHPDPYAQEQAYLESLSAPDREKVDRISEIRARVEAQEAIATRMRTLGRQEECDRALERMDFYAQEFLEVGPLDSQLAAVRRGAALATDDLIAASELSPAEVRLNENKIREICSVLSTSTDTEISASAVVHNGVVYAIRHEGMSPRDFEVHVRSHKTLGSTHAERTLRFAQSSGLLVTPLKDYLTDLPGVLSHEDYREMRNPTGADEEEFEKRDPNRMSNREYRAHRERMEKRKEKALDHLGSRKPIWQVDK